MREDEIVPGRRVREEGLVELRRRARLLVADPRAERVLEQEQALVGARVPARVAHRPRGEERGAQRALPVGRGFVAGGRAGDGQKESGDREGPVRAKHQGASKGRVGARAYE